MDSAITISYWSFLLMTTLTVIIPIAMFFIARYVGRKECEGDFFREMLSQYRSINFDGTGNRIQAGITIPEEITLSRWIKFNECGWHHICVITDRTIDNTNMYIDGIPKMMHKDIK